MSADTALAEAYKAFMYGAVWEASMNPRLRDDRHVVDKAAAIADMVALGMALASFAPKKYHTRKRRSAAMILDGISAMSRTGQVEGMDPEWVAVLQGVATRAANTVPDYQPTHGPILWERFAETSPSPAPLRAHHLHAPAVPTSPSPPSTLQHESWPPLASAVPAPAPRSPAAASTEQLLRTRAEQLTLEEIIATFSPGAIRLQNEDIDPAVRMAFTRQVTSLARKADLSVQFERDMGTCFITGYLVGRLALGTHRDRVAYSVPGEREGNCERILQLAASLRPSEVVHGQAMNAFFSSSGTWAQSQGLFAGVGDRPGFLAEQAILLGYMLAIAEHELFVDQ